MFRTPPLRPFQLLCLLLVSVALTAASALAHRSPKPRAGGGMVRSAASPAAPVLPPHAAVPSGTELVNPWTAPPAEQSGPPGTQRTVNFRVRNNNTVARTFSFEASSWHPSVIPYPANPANVTIPAESWADVPVTYQVTGAAGDSAWVTLWAIDTGNTAVRAGNTFWHKVTPLHNPWTAPPAAQVGPVGTQRTVNFRVRNNNTVARTFSFEASSWHPSVIPYPANPANMTIPAESWADVPVTYQVVSGTAGDSAWVTLWAVDTGNTAVRAGNTFWHRVAPNTIPTARFTVTPAQGTERLAVTLDGSTSSDAEGPISAYVWAWQDDNGNWTGSGTSVRVQPIWSRPGNYGVQLLVRDSHEATGTTMQTVTVNPNTGPTARFTVTPSEGIAGQPVTLDGSTSSDADGPIGVYVWAWQDDNGNWTGSGSGVRVQPTWSRPGTYGVQLLVRDAHEATGTTTQTVTVKPATVPPLLVDNVRSKPLVVGMGRHTAGYTIRNRSNIARTYTFAPGESTGGLTFPSVPAPLTLAPSEERHLLLAFDVPEHLQEGAALTLVLGATDSEGAAYGTASVSLPVQVSHLRPRVSIDGYGYLEGSPGQSKTVRVHVRNPRGEPRYICMNWLDDEVYIGHEQVARPTPPALCEGFGAGETRSFDFGVRFHDHAGPGLLDRQVLQVYSTQETEHQSTWVQLYTRTVSATPNRNPLAGFTWSPAAPYPGDVVTFDASSSSDPDSDVLAYNWSLGNGTTATGSSVTASYGAIGDVSVTLTVSDPQGGTATLTRSVGVRGDTQAPTIAFQKPDGTRFTRPDAIVAIDWTDNRGLDPQTIRITEDGAAVPAARMPLIGESPTARQTHLTLALKPGMNRIRAAVSDLAGNAAAPVEVTYHYDEPGVLVTPDDASVTLGASGTYTRAFTVRNTGSAPTTYQLVPECDLDRVASCTVPGSSVGLGVGESTSVVVTFTTGATAGSGGWLRLRAADANPPFKQDVGSLTVQVAAGKIVVTPASGTVQAPANTSGYRQAFQVSNYTGEDVSLGSYPNCPDAAVLTGCVMQQGDALRAFAAGQTQTVYVVANTGPSGAAGTLGLTVNIPDRTTVHARAVLTVQLGAGSGGGGTPVAATVTAPQPHASLPLNHGANTAVRFTVSNPGSVPATYLLGTSCTPGVLGCSLPSGSQLVDPGGSVGVDVNVTASGAVGTGTVTLTATLGGTGAVSTAGQSITVTDATSKAPFVALDPATSIPLVERGLCLTIAAGHEGASECGDLRLAHALPTVRTFNKARTPVLLYNSQHAGPNPLVALDITARPSDEPLVEMQVTVSGGPAGAKWSFTKSWPGAQFPAGQARRVVVSDAVLAGLPTGIHAYQVTVSAVYGTTPHPAPARSGELVVVNRRLDPAGTQLNPLGAGWWLAGLERIYRQGDDLVWVGGDGSVRRYTPGPDGTWAGPPLAGPDRIVRGLDNGYVRELRGGARVVFDFGGRHVATENRQGHRTVFGYQGEALTTITVPTPGQAAMTYTFDYRTAGEVRITAPGAPARQTVFSLVDGTVRSIRDPDQTAVRFEYYGNSGYVRYRDNRLLHRSEYRYDPSGKVSAGKIHMDPAADSVVLRIRPQESRGHTGPVPLDSVNTFIDGPRRDVADTTRIWLNRFSAPDSIVNALGQRTRLHRTDSRFPALVTGLHLASGFSTTASYDARGNLEQSLEIDPLGDGRNAETRYGYTDPRWPDFVTRVELPEDEVATIEYDAAGNRIWQQPGERNLVSSRRATFHYHTEGALRGMLHQVESPSPTGSGTVLETVTYDPQRGNLESTTTPKGYTTTLETDLLGRVTKIHAPIDSDPADTTRFLYRTEEVLEYDLMDRALRTVTRAPAMNGVPAEMLYVSTTYDEEGLPRRVTRSNAEAADPASSITMRWTYDRAGRLTHRFSPDKTPADSTDNPYELTEYDPAGNARVVRTRRKDPLGQAYAIEMEYDVLNRLKLRRVPRATYDGRSEGIPKYYGPSGGSCASSVSALLRTYPGRPNDGCGYAVAAQVDTFSYDVAGNLVVADNGDAWVRRSYYPNGLLRGDTLYVRTTEGSDFSRHVYGLESRYDRDGRRTELKHPGQLAPTQNPTRYGYNPATGELETVTDPLNNEFRYVYGTTGQLEVLRLPGGIEESYGFDRDGNLRAHAVSGGVRSVTLEHDPRGKVRSVVNSLGSRDRLALLYSGMGNLVQTDAYVYGEPGSEQPTFHGAEGMLYGGHHNLDSSTSWEVIRSKGQTTTRNTGVQRSFYYEGTTDRLTQILNSGTIPYGDATRTVTRYDGFMYDGAGNLDFETQLYGVAGSCDSQVKGEADCADRASFYSADGLLRAAEQRTRSGSDDLNRWSVVFEEYRYDALGRRIWVRDRRECGGEMFEGLPASCHSTVRRTVWDGQQELYEIQMPGEDGSAYLENDVAAIPVRPYRSWLPYGPTPQPIPSDYFAYDPNPYFGRVAYTHGLGVDRPLSLIRVGYQRYYPAQMPSTGGQAASFSTFALIPVWDWRGQAEGTLFADGSRKRCQTFDGVQRCVDGGVRERWHSYTVGDVFFQEWHGTVLGGKKDGTGTMYRRARYYDPQSGRFTQEDPIGLAGGLNLYGYAEGDPANLSDPSGNLPIPAITAAIGGIGGAIIGTGVYLATTPRSQWSLGGGLAYAGGGAVAGAFAGLTFGAVAPGLSVSGITALGLGRLLPAAGGDLGALQLAGGSVATATAAASSATAGSQVVIQFGKDANQVHHAFRHVLKLGLDPSDVMAAVEQHLPTVISQLQPGRTLNQIVIVGGHKLQYSAHLIANGVINVGRIHKVP